jgi:hypothetical protein
MESEREAPPAEVSSTPGDHTPSTVDYEYANPFADQEAISSGSSSVHSEPPPVSARPQPAQQEEDSIVSFQLINNSMPMLMFIASRPCFHSRRVF